MITRKRAAELASDLRGRRILVVGDLMLDRYVAGDVERISPEAPVPIVRIRSEHSRPGGAANVALNIQAMGGQSIVGGMVGNDAAGDELLGLLACRGIETDGVVMRGGQDTTVKTRIMADRQQIVRVDRDGQSESIAELVPGLCSAIEGIVSDIDGIIIEDYGKGCITQDVVNVCTSAARERGLVIGLDPKDSRDLDIPWITVATPNYKEACAAVGMREQPLNEEPAGDPHLLELARRLRQKWNAAFMAITLGPLGMCLLGDDADPVVIPTRAQEVFDVSGAGDTVIAVTVLAMAGGADFFEAAALANSAAGVVVGKVGTAPCTTEELLESLN